MAYETDSISTSTVQMEKLKHTDIKWFAQGTELIEAALESAIKPPSPELLLLASTMQL